MNATDTQVGGEHHLEMPYQLVRLIAEFQVNFFQGSIIKYLCRHKDKDGLRDLQKAKSYCQLAQKLRPADECTYGTKETGRLFRAFCRENSISPGISFALDAVLWSDWDTAEELISDLIQNLSE